MPVESVDTHAPVESVEPRAHIDTGIPGLNEILEGGLTPNRAYLIEGGPGSGKTTLGIQFLLAGVAAGERCLYITLAESAEELHETARNHGWSLEGVDVVELLPADDLLASDTQYTMFHPAEVELGETMRRVLEHAERVKPRRLVFDALTELRLLSQNALRYRRQLHALKRFLARQSCTVMLLDDQFANHGSTDVFSLAHAVLYLTNVLAPRGGVERTVQVIKFRGHAFLAGCHDVRLAYGGLTAFPRLVDAVRTRQFDGSPVQEMGSLSELLGGALPAGTSTLVVGPPGTGKTTLAAQFALAAARGGQRATVFLFEEPVAGYVERLAKIGTDFSPYVEQGAVTIHKLNPVGVSFGEFVQRALQAVERDNASVLIVDTLSWYLGTAPRAPISAAYLSELLSALGQLGTTTILVSARRGLHAEHAARDIDASYLVDAVLALCHVEIEGEMRKAVSVIKKRSGTHARTLHELTLGADGFRIGAPLSGFHGVLESLTAQYVDGTLGLPGASTS